MATGVVDERAVRRLTDARSFERGRAYFEAGRVRAMVVDDAAVTAVVHGGSVYRVRLEVGPTGLDGRCSCPYGSEGVFCKHCVATVLAWLHGDFEPPRPRLVSDDELLRFLTAQDSAWLAEELLRAAATDPMLRARLDVAAGAGAADAVDERPLRVDLERAIEIRDYVGYREAYSYVRGVDEQLARLRSVIEQGFPDAAMRLAEYALELLHDSAGLIDDSDGGLGGLMSRAAEIHLEACEAAEPDPRELAEYLVNAALNSDHETFLGALHDYADVLGPDGVARYRELVEAAWRALPPKQPHDYRSGRFAITFLMERLAELEGGTDAWIAVLARDVSTGYDVLRIAQRLCADGRDDEALEWLDRGLTEFAPDSRLRSLAAECHLRAGRRAAAEELLWQNFAAGPGLPGYIALHDVAAENFPAWRDRAVKLLGGPTQRPPTALIEVLLWEGEIDAAWQAAAAGGCHHEQRLRLARARAATHPADAIPILTSAAELRIGYKNRGAYQEATKLLVEAGGLYARCDRDIEFRSYLTGLRNAHRSKRALREELDRAALP